MKIDSYRQVRTRLTNKQTQIVTPWAPDGAKKPVSPPGSVQFVPHWLTLCAPSVAGGEVQHPGLCVRDLEGVSVNLVNTVTGTQASVACHATMLNIFRVLNMEFSSYRNSPWGNKSHSCGSGGVVRVIVQGEVVIVGVSVELASDGILKPETWHMTDMTHMTYDKWHIWVMADESLTKQICPVTPKYKLWDNCFYLCDT